ncbi:MAG: hypothetical protein ACRD1T_00605 [Acidimicrobiia bacterium]
MGKTSAASRQATQRRRNQARKKRKPPSFYQRYRSWILIASVAVAVVLIAVMRSGDEKATSPMSKAFTGGDFHSMVFDPENPRRIFVGGHEAVSVSIDGGKSFRPVASLKSRDAMGWGFDGSTVYMSGHPGLMISTDGGKIFSEHNQGLPATDLHSFGAGRSVLYAGSPAGFLSSSDGAKTWRVVNRNEGRSFFGRILVDATDTKHLVAADAASGVAESKDGGGTWTELGGPRSPTWVSWDLKNPLLIVASGQSGASISTDGGKTWRDLEIPSGATIVDIDPSDSQVLVAGTHDGANVTMKVSRDRGRSWASP